MAIPLVAGVGIAITGGIIGGAVGSKVKEAFEDRYMQKYVESSIHVPEYKFGGFKTDPEAKERLASRVTFHDEETKRLFKENLDRVLK